MKLIIWSIIAVNCIQSTEVVRNICSQTSQQKVRTDRAISHQPIRRHTKNTLQFALVQNSSSTIISREENYFLHRPAKVERNSTVHQRHERSSSTNHQRKKGAPKKWIYPSNTCRHTAKIKYRIFETNIPRKEYRGPGPNFHIHASVSDLYIS